MIVKVTFNPGPASHLPSGVDDSIILLVYLPGYSITALQRVPKAPEMIRKAVMFCKLFFTKLSIPSVKFGLVN